jgi:glycosyltransferase involved in cell wall biosynthesis
MKILMVVHQFLPRHIAGTEVYTFHLARALQARGHGVHLYFTEIRPDRPQYELTRGEYCGVPYSEVVHNRYFGSFRQTYSDPRMEEHFRTILDDVTPDLVHFQHLHLHSIGYIDIAHQRRLPMLYTLHEYMLICLSDGLLLRPGLKPCEAAQIRECARCAVGRHAGLPLESPPAGSWRALASRAARSLERLVARDDDSERRYVEPVRQRQAEIRAALNQVDLFVAPSRFLHDRFVDEQFISADRIVHSDYGFVARPPETVPSGSSDVLRVGYLGTIAEYKGVHLIVEAVTDLPPDRIECRVFGDLDTFPQYKKRLLGLGVPSSVRYMGRVENDAVPDALAQLDVLIVPSLWAENSPLTIHEAQLAGIPVVTSDYGGMAELVEHGKTGLHFRRGDAADLRRQLRRLLDEPGLLQTLRRERPAIKTIEQDAAQTEERYRDILKAKVS